MGKFMDGLNPADKMDLLKYHSILGILVLVLTLLRVYFYFKHDRPERVKTGNKINDKFAILIHNSFYFILIGLTLSGIAVMIVGGYGNALVEGLPELIKPHSENPPLEVHELLAATVMIVLVVHVVGVIKHFIFRKENIFKRIF